MNTINNSIIQATARYLKYPSNNHFKNNATLYYQHYSTIKNNKYLYHQYFLKTKNS